MNRVLINHFSPIPNKITGISVYTWNIVAALAKHGENDYILSTNWNLANLPATIAELGIEILHRPSPINETLSAAQATIDLRRIARQRQCNAIFHPQPTSMLAGMRTSVVVVHDLYRVTHSHLFNWKQKLQWSQIVARGFRGAGRLIAVSEATRAAVVDAYPDLADKVSVVHEASPVDFTSTTEQPTGEPYGLMVANITPNKNVKLLVDALKLLADRGARPLVYLVGRDELGALPGLIGARTDIRLVQLGTASAAELQRLYAHAHVYLNTSLVEGFCLPLLEAHTYGVPVICSDLPVLREVAGAGAQFVDVQDPAPMAAAISEMFKNPVARETLSEAARSNVNRFSWEKAARETEAVINAVSR